MIEFDRVSKHYKSKIVLSDISFKVNKGELVVLIGPSGCGKTTSLKMINRLIKPTSGQIRIDGQDIEKRDIIELRRNVGYVIQQTGLFPHMTVRENIELVPRLQGADVKKVTDRSAELMAMVDLDPGEYLDRYPTQLSGGQQQRIGVARAFACDPEIILMDEPFSAVDPITRSQLQDELAMIQAKVKKTIVFVTHDIEEAIKIGSRICFMNGGKIVQYDLCEEILKNPASDFIKEFVGKYRIWSAPELIRAKDIMIPDPVTSPADENALWCLEAMRRRGVGSVVLVSGKKRFRGIVYSKSVRACADKRVPAMELAEKDTIAVGPDDSIPDILTLVHKTNAVVVPVVDKAGILCGIITQSSLVMTLSQQFIDNDRVW